MTSHGGKAMCAKTKQSCPICKTLVSPSERYRRYVCAECASRASDEQGRKLAFGNIDFGGGFQAAYADTGEKREGHECFIDGVKCWADEARFGGIVIEVGDGPSLRAGRA